MSKALNAILAVLGAWLIISPIILLYPLPYMFVTIAFGVIILIVAIVEIKMKESKAGPDYFIDVLAVLLVIWGIMGLVAKLDVFGVGERFGSGVNEIISGILIFAIALLATKFRPEYVRARFFDRGGSEMVDIKGLRIKDDNILMKANLLQSMPSTIYVHSDDIWKLLTMIDWDMVKSLPGYLKDGYKKVKEEEKKGNFEDAKTKDSKKG